MDPVARGLAASAKASATSAAFLAAKTVRQRGPAPTDDTAHGFTATGAYWQFDGDLWQAKRITATLAAWQALGSDAAPLVTATGVAAVAAYGLRKIVSGYAGNCLQVVRGSDSTTLDIGFGSDGWIDAAALSAFLAGTTGKVTKWYDQSGNVRDAVQTTDAQRPLITALYVNGRPAITMQGGDASLGLYLDMPATVSVDRQACTVAAIGLPAYDGGLTWDLSSGGTMMNYHSSGGSAASETVIYTGANIAGRPQNAGRACLAGLVSGVSGYTSFTDDEVTTGSAISSATVTTGRIGATNFAITSKFSQTALWQAFVVWGQAFTATQLDNLRRATYRQFNIYPQQRDNVFTLGDSITLGAQARNDNWPRQMRPSINRPVDVWNMSELGWTIDNMTTNAAVRLAAVKKSGANNICILWGGTNNLKALETPAATYAKLVTLAGIVRGAGYKLILATALPRNDWTGGVTDADRLAYNALITAGWAGIADGLADVGADPTMGVSAANADATLYPDGIHPSALGCSYLAPTFAAAVNALLR